MGVHAGSKISIDDLYNYHVCTASGTFTPGFTGTVEVLVVAGGGGGGMDMGGGGGGGGVISNTSYSVTSGTGITVTVGAGGTGAPAAGTSAQGYQNGHQYPTSATNGGNSVFGTLTAIGGGYGGSSYYGYTPNYGLGGSGGSGGGSSGYTAGATTTGASGTAGQGNKGGNAGGGSYYSGGGGGAASAGIDGPNQPNGGSGVLNSILGVPYYWGGGGGGSSYSLSIGGNGGIGGGGGGGIGYTTGGAGLNPGQPGGGGYPNTQTNCHGGAGGRNTGGGGGGGSHYNSNNNGGNGGSGIVIIRYLKTLGTSTFASSSATPNSSLLLSVDGYNVGKSVSVEVLVVAGGGGGGNDMGGGGGGGGVIYNPSYSVAINSAINVVIGGGGAGSPGPYASYPVAGSSGGDTTFGNLIALGGGGGGSGHREVPWAGTVGQPGGCGGGDSARYTDYTSLSQGYDRNLFDRSQGQDGGRSSPINAYHAGGGGGASQPGGGGGNTYGGNGGTGFLSGINGTAYYWAGGGGGATFNEYSGAGGSGGGGGGSNWSAGTPGTGGAGYNNGAAGTISNAAVGGAGGANSGGGGGGGAHQGNGGAGGSGIVIVRYAGAQKATGGNIITTSGGYTVHTFLASGTFTPTSWMGAKDLSNVKNNVSSYNVTTTSVGGNSFVFDGTSSYMDVGANSYGLGIRRSATYSCWIYPTTTAAIVGISDYGTNGLGMNLRTNSSTSADFYVYPNNHRITYTYAFNPNIWYNLVGVMDSANMYMYLNGVLVGSNTLGEDIGISAQNLKIGARGEAGFAPGATQWGTGYIGHVTVHNYALTADQIQQNFQAMRGRFGI